MSNNDTSRRAILAGAAGVTASGLLSGAALASGQHRAEPSPLVLEHRRLRACIRYVEAQMNADLEAGVTPAMAKLEERLDALCDLLTEVDERIAEWECIDQETLNMGYLADRATAELISSLRALLTG